MKKYIFFTITAAMALLVAACTPANDPPATEMPSVTEPMDAGATEATEAPGTEAATEEATEAATESTGTSDASYLTDALADAGLQEDEVQVVVDRRVQNPHREISIVKFIHENQLYFYKFMDGNVTEKHMNPIGDFPVEAQRGDMLTEDEALQIALDRAGVNQADIDDLEIDIDHDDGHYVYEIEFDVNDREYEYDIDLYSGEILKEEIDD